MVAAQRSGFSRRLAALANAAMIEASIGSKTQKSYDLARRKAVGCNPMFGRKAVDGATDALGLGKLPYFYDTLMTISPPCPTPNPLIVRTK
jgi:hypothetical protein